MPQRKTEISLILFILIDILSISAFLYLYNITQDLIAETIEKGDLIKIELKKDDAKILMKDDINQGKIYKDKLMSYVIPAEGTVDFIKVLEQLISSSGVKADIKSVSSEAYDKGTAIGLELVRVNIDITGDWSGVKYLLNLIENYPLKIDVKKIAFSKFSDLVKKGVSIPQWSGNIEFTAVKTKDNK